MVLGLCISSLSLAPLSTKLTSFFLPLSVQVLNSDG